LPHHHNGQHDKSGVASRRITFSSQSSLDEVSTLALAPPPTDPRSVDRPYFLGLGVNAMQWPWGLISPSTILQVPRDLGDLPAMN
jgi:hypothetical protein